MDLETKFKNIFNLEKNFRLSGEDRFLLYFLISIFILSYILYILIFFSPSGTDVYSHMYNTQRMADSNSLDQFYEKSLIEEYRGYDYPFGLWYFGSIVMKITGLDIYTIVYIIPLILLIGTLLIYYCYAFEFTKAENQSIMSLIFLISMTTISLALLNFSTGIFVMPYLVGIFFLALRKIEWKNELLIFFLIFTLSFTHTGTFLFLITFSVAFFFIQSIDLEKI